MFLTKGIGAVVVSAVVLVLLCDWVESVNLAQARADLARGGRAVCPYCWACTHQQKCDRPCRPLYRHLCPFCQYGIHCSTTCVNLCPFPEPTPPPEPTTPEPTTPGPETPAPTPTEPGPDPCTPNPCFLNGNCRAESLATGGYRCSCPPNVDSCTEQSMNVYNRYDFDRNGPSVERLALLNPLTALDFKSIYDDTFDQLQASGLPGIHNGIQDAARHALTNYRWTREKGADLAKQFADAYERSNPNIFSERAMDLHNNAAGRRLAQDPANAGRNDIDVIREALMDGTLQTSLSPGHSSVVDTLTSEQPGENPYQ